MNHALFGSVARIEQEWDFLRQRKENDLHLSETRLVRAIFPATGI